MITQETVYTLFVLVIFGLFGLMLYVSKKRDDKRRVNRVKTMQLHVQFNDGWTLTYGVVSCYQAQQLLNRFNWATVQTANVVIDGAVEYTVNTDGLLVYVACTS